jgi:hypothetical protein
MAPMTPPALLVARIVLGVGAAYAAAGLLIGACFVAWGIARVDPAARGAPLLVRMLLLPGTAALWPLMAAKWWRAMRKGAPS